MKKPAKNKQGAARKIQAALSHQQAGRFAEAEQIYRQVLAVDPNNFDAWHLLGVIAFQVGMLEEAFELISQAIKLSPSIALAHFHLALVLKGQGKTGEAVASYKKALAINPNYVDAHGNLAFLFQEEGRLEEAGFHYQKMLSLKPGNVDVLNNLGNVFKAMGKMREAIECYKKALALKPGYVAALNNLGTVFQEQGKIDEAVSCYRQVLNINPAYVKAHYNLGVILQENGKAFEAKECFRQVLELDPHYHAARAYYVHQLQNFCEWAGFAENVQIIRQVVRELPATDNNRISAFAFLAFPGVTPQEQKLCAEKWAHIMYSSLLPLREKLGFDFNRAPNGKIRLAYISADFREHPVSQLMAQVFELHDRNRFHVSAYSYGPNDGSVMRARLEAAFDEFVDIAGLSIEDSARRIHADRIDILVDLTGYTTYSRSGILALRPAPVQVGYLGYLGTMGADFADYIIADPFLIPKGHEQYYSERIAYLESYQANDRNLIVAQTPSREECGLPENAVVFCSFNQSFKITPEVFDVWCKLLAAVPESVLWLYANSVAADNLRREAMARGVSPERLIFAERVPLDKHLARMKCADLFLDSTPYNAGTTASNALWVGLPIVTCAGKTFASRMAGSLLTALGVPELISHSLEEYYALALDLANDKAKRAAFREKIIANLDSSPLFDSDRFTRNLEAALDQMISVP